MNNQELTNNQLQVILTGLFGDGHLTKPRGESSNSTYVTNCIHKDYIQYKSTLLGDLSLIPNDRINMGFKEGTIYTVASKADIRITNILFDSYENNLNKMDELGLALWFYDDGSLHKNKHFYNLNTHAFPRETQEDLFIPFLKKFGIIAKTTIERKKDGRIFYYLSISRHTGAYEISNILRKYYVECYNYKIWSSETIQIWSSVLEYAKSENISLKPCGFTKLCIAMERNIRYSPNLQETVRDSVESTEL